MEELIQSIQEAEERAQKLKADARERAAAITAEAEQSASALLSACEKECAEKRLSSLALARDGAQKEYEKSIAEAEAEAKQYADGVLKDTKSVVSRIVRRVCGDR